MPAATDVPAWKGPVIQVASMCQHLTGVRHRLVVMDLEGLVVDLSSHLTPPEFIINLGGLQVSSVGLVLKGFAAVDIWAVLNNVLWEDEHCLSCCGALIRFTESLGPYVLVRCGPTIGDVGGVSMDEAGRIIDEYWTD